MNYKTYDATWHTLWNTVSVTTLSGTFYIHSWAIGLYCYFAGLNTKVWTAISVTHLLVWAVWAAVSRHPSRWKLWLVVLGGCISMLLDIYDFPPYRGYVDAHALWHATNIPVTYLWWSFVRDDAEFRTLALLNKVK